jgi:hypothetical protein
VSKVDTMMVAVSGAMFALGLAQLGMVLRDRTREPAARRFYRAQPVLLWVRRLGTRCQGWRCCY